MERLPGEGSTVRQLPVVVDKVRAIVTALRKNGSNSAIAEAERIERDAAQRLMIEAWEQLGRYNVLSALASVRANDWYGGGIIEDAEGTAFGETFTVGAKLTFRPTGYEMLVQRGPDGKPARLGMPKTDVAVDISTTLGIEYIPKQSDSAKPYIRIYDVTEPLELLSEMSRGRHGKGEIDRFRQAAALPVIAHPTQEAQDVLGMALRQRAWRRIMVEQMPENIQAFVERHANRTPLFGRTHGRITRK